MNNMTGEAQKMEPIMRTIRRAYIKGMLAEDEIDNNPIRQFEKWLDFAFKTGNEHANAMVLSTVGTCFMPDSRVVLLRDISHGGFTFFTNYKSKKARDIKENANASLLFFWPEHERQVKVQGEIRFLPSQESDEYFESRPFESKVGALVSEQSSVIKDRKEMELAFANELKKYKNKKVPRPDHWGGYVLAPTLFEFWQGRDNRLHDRIQYRLDKSTGRWIIERLMP